MIRIASLFWLALVALSGFATFKVKYTVQDIEEELNKARKQTIAEQQEIHVLRAEWTALNQPERLAELNRRVLSLAAITPKQLQHRIEDIPLRPMPEPAEPLIAAAPAPDPAALGRVPVDVHPGSDPASPAAATPANARSDADTVVAVAPVPKPAVANLQLISSAEAAPSVAAPAVLKPAPARLEARPQLAKIRSAQQPRSLDRLIDEIAGSR